MLEAILTALFAWLELVSYWTLIQWMRERRDSQPWL